MLSRELGKEKADFQVMAMGIALFRHAQHGDTAKNAKEPRSPTINIL
jgi:hypothetical protein